MEAQRQRVDVREGGDTDLAQRVILHLGEHAVAQLRDGRGEDARHDLRGDQSGHGGKDRQRRIVVEPVDQPAVEERNGGVRDLGEDQTDQRKHDPPFELRLTRGPEIGHQRPERPQGRRAVAFFHHGSRHLVPHVPAAEGEEAGDDRDQGDDSQDDGGAHG